ncbi:MAG: hypothetical protein J6O55_04255 [Lachnospiraceae bacterium]|nr:hypothetical protein [Lachnospiraceae bacterium]
MPINEKKLNVNLLDRLDMIERIRKAKEKGEKELEEQLDMEERQILRKLYQEPLVRQDNQ